MKRASVLRAVIWWIPATLVALGLSGCAELREGRTKVVDEFSSLTAGARKADKGNGAGFWSDSRSSEIERNLGVR